MKDTKDCRGVHVTFEDGRKGITSGGDSIPVWAIWVRSLDGQICHQYHVDIIRARIITGDLVFPVS